MKHRRLNAALLASLAAAALCGCAHRETHRYFQPSATQLSPFPNSYGQAVIPRQGLIVVQGDDFLYGPARGRSRHRINGADEGQASITLSQTLRHALKDVRVENRSFPGDTIASSVERWGDQPPGDLAILSFTYGDAAAHTPLEDFKEQLTQLIRLDQASGAVVFVVIPPPLGEPIRDSELSDYRYALKSAARAAGAEVFDTWDSMQRLKLHMVKTVAQPAALYQAVGADMVPYIKVVDAPSPQTGQAGSADSRTVRVSPASAS